MEGQGERETGSFNFKFTQVLTQFITGNAMRWGFRSTTLLSEEGLSLQPLPSGQQKENERNAILTVPLR